MDANPPAIRRLCVAATGWPLDDLADVLAAACAAARLDRLLWGSPVRSPWAGVLHPGVDESRAVADLVHATWVALGAHNAAAARPLAIRLAIAEGLTVLRDGEFDGPGVRMADALCDRAPLSAGLEVAVSGRILDDIRAVGGARFPLAGFRPFRPGSWLAVFGQGGM
ncbi:hypothetical protein [Acrocarpospora catenulata]|uniref:hypothetical protein n=1 Tax=Acrocarpospora catenulata TaxID=2836182 RepID=UPI001BDA74AD|nr:hypothetical protein [Acrocarpospora catenulata]